MLKKMSLLFLFSTIFGLTLSHTAVFAEPKLDLAPHARSAILMDAGTGTIIYEKNSHEPLPPASITKVMTMLLTMEALEKKAIRWEDPVRVSERAASMGGTQIFLQPGEQMTVRDLLKGVAIASANDASVALAEYIGGTEEQFIKMMNQRAKELGLKNTKFQNSNGLPVKDHYSSAYDIAVMSRELLKHPQITKFTGLYEDYLRKNSAKPFWLVNTNKLVRFYPGVDGIKTGYTSEAKYCLTATAQKGPFRVIAVVMGEPDAKTRNKEISQMLDYAFNHYTNVVFYKKGDFIAKARVDKGEKKFVEIYAREPISIMIKKGENPKEITQQLIWQKVQAPIQKGQVLGKLQFRKGGKKIAELDLISSLEIKKAGLWTQFKQVVDETLF